MTATALTMTLYRGLVSMLPPIAAAIIGSRCVSIEGQATAKKPSTTVLRHLSGGAIPQFDCQATVHSDGVGGARQYVAKNGFLYFTMDIKRSSCYQLKQLERANEIKSIYCDQVICK